MKFFNIIILFIVFCTPSLAAEDENPFHVTELPLPRFASLSAGKVYVRTGPGKNYPVRWEYSKRGLPVEIILEFDHWRKIKDSQGEGGWVHRALLSGKRNALILKGGDNNIIPLYRTADADSAMVARAQSGAIVGISTCEIAWCEVSGAGYSGYLEKKFLWGVYPNEEIR